ncbi:hypothetical protein [Segatella oris]|uniref:hypothetical protein n=1 Tax=Segatella oris TaxID=28135 RepID=UPI0028EA7862|nr:hypothetical protein [Segatella oris]
MESFVEHIFVLLGASALVIAVFFLVFHFSPVRTLPSMVTLRVKAILGILAATFLTVVSVVLSVRYNHELQQLFPNLFEYGVLPAVSLSAVILLSFLICFVFKYEKAVWLHRNPKRSRLMLQAVNHTFKVKGVSIGCIDGINNGRGVSFSWFDGRFIAAGKHKVTFQFYTYRKLRRYAAMDIVYTKDITMEFLPGAVYMVEARPGSKNFYVTRDMKRSI